MLVIESIPPSHYNNYPYRILSTLPIDAKQVNDILGRHNISANLLSFYTLYFNSEQDAALFVLAYKEPNENTY